MSRQSQLAGCLVWAACFAVPLLALDPHKTFTQYTRAVWTQADGLPQDTVHSMAQTSDGYLWLGTEEGLARFDGYDFTTFKHNNSALPSDAISALAAGPDGTLWVGTPAGLALYRNGQFTTFTASNGLPDNRVTSLCEDHAGVLWIAAGTYLIRFANGSFTTFPADRLRPIQAIAAIYEDPDNVLWLAGLDGLVKFDGVNFIVVLRGKEFGGMFVSAMVSDHEHNLWIGGTKGILALTRNGTLRKFDMSAGLPDNLISSLHVDRGGTVWVGSNGGLSRLEGGRFVSPAENHAIRADGVRSLFEDRENNLWVGTNIGLNRLHDDRFTGYGRAEGLPSDEPTTVHQDRNGDIWVGYHAAGLVSIHQGHYRLYSTRDGLPSNEIFAIRETRQGDLLLSTRRGLSRFREGTFSNTVLPDSLGRFAIFDAIEDRQGRIWLAGATGLNQMIGPTLQKILPGGLLPSDVGIALSEDRDGSIWLATFGSGLWRVAEGPPRHYTSADGLSSERIRSLYQDPDGTLWIGTVGGGLNAFRDGHFDRYFAKDGLLSDNISHIDDDGNGALWLSTPRGICKIAKQQLTDFSTRRIAALTPVNYGVQDGLRSAQVGPGYPVGGGGTKTADGRLWFTTSQGLAVVDPAASTQYDAPVIPIVQVVAVTVDGQNVDPSQLVKLKPGTGHVRVQYTGLHLSSPESINYFYKLEGLDRDWISAGARRTVDYESLRHGSYRFLVKASLRGQASSEASVNLEMLPHIYETAWFLWLCICSGGGVVYGLYKLRLQQIQSRFSLVLEERARFAREIHDTLAQGFIGISRQLDAIGMRTKGDDKIVQRHLELAQKMARHSLTEAKRSVMDLRAPALDQGDLSSALTAAAREWTAAKAVPFEIDVTGTLPKLRDEVEHNLLRISQEAVNNALLHADADKIWIRLRAEPDRLLLSVKDNGRGFEFSNAFVAAGGHFGLLGMRERAERLGGVLVLLSEPGFGTQVEVSVPLNSENLRNGSRTHRESDHPKSSDSPEVQ